MRCGAELHAGRQQFAAWHAERPQSFRACKKADVKRLVVKVPPRHLKSLAASVALPAWLLGHDPALAVVNVTYAQELSEKFARDCRAVMTLGVVSVAVFDKARFAPRASGAELRTTCGGSRIATSVGGVLTGRGADVIMIDDPLKPVDAMSESRRAAANDWFNSTLYSPAQRQGEGGDRHRDAAPARGRSRGPRAGARRLGRRLASAIAEDESVHAIDALGTGRVCRAGRGPALRSASRSRRSSA